MVIPRTKSAAPRRGGSTGADVSAEPFRPDRLASGLAGDRRSRLGIAASVAIHVALVGLALALPVRVRERRHVPRQIDVVFYREPALPEEPVTPRFVPEMPPTFAPPKPVDRPTPTLVPPPRRPQPVEVHEPRPAPPIEPQPPRQTESVRRVPRPEPTAPVVRTDVFALTKRRASGPSPESGTVRTDTFENARRSARTVTSGVRTARTGAFAMDASAEDPARRAPASPATAQVGVFGTGPGAPAVSAPSTGGGQSRVEVAGFDATAPSGDSAPASRSDRGTVRRGTFGDLRPVEARPSRPRQIRDPELAVEIVSKPKPSYTDEARRLGVEGEVVLEVVFEASGRLRVLRVVQSLGYGLDDAAVEAARRIDFKPARRDGRPIDFTAMLRVVFKLA